MEKAVLTKKELRAARRTIYLISVEGKRWSPSTFGGKQEAINWAKQQGYSLEDRTEN